MVVSTCMKVTCLLLVLCAVSGASGNVITNLLSKLQQELVAMLDTVTESVISVGSENCAALKEIFGVTYEQIEGEDEPDVNLLSVVYKTSSDLQIYNISTAAQSLQDARVFESHEKLMIFVHGFTDNPTTIKFADISKAVFNSDEAEHITLLALDCSSLIRWLYLRCTTYVVYIGYKLAELLYVLVQNGLLPSQIHLVGHSLGSHICGFAGKKYYNITGEKIGRISGLDPAGPCFTNVTSTYKLNATDADYVDVMHTNAGVYGIDSPVGHADYFPNRGKHQPGCASQSCSHGSTCVFFAESLLRKGAFPAMRCDSWEAFKEGTCYDDISYMGYASNSSSGLYYLQTEGSSPYGRGMNGVTYNSTF